MICVTLLFNIGLYILKKKKEKKEQSSTLNITSTRNHYYEEQLVKDNLTQKHKTEIINE